ncbi:hypothetical protein J7T55_000117 [Diaporthe amygdali]|uniref:uncharacterized protein n=1 Tax=Phomopsis amygdali TaxID=1214568 RepID=UPI0022FE63DE|nr:uncharacterized protein J7T55_000117 [Diaporthe amygdali]KAJ0100758.1 hypothetical protein J7T55_000117 [Diaporthe amygdali]
MLNYDERSSPSELLDSTPALTSSMSESSDTTMSCCDECSFPFERAVSTTTCDGCYLSPESSASTMTCDGSCCCMTDVAGRVGNDGDAYQSLYPDSHPGGTACKEGDTTVGFAGAKDVGPTRMPAYWSLHCISLWSGTPLVVVRSSPLAWVATDVYDLDPDALNNFCARFSRWVDFFHPTANDHKVLPLYPPKILPGRHRILDISDMILRGGEWYVILRVEACMSLEEVQNNDDIRPWVSRRGGVAGAGVSSRLHSEELLPTYE